MSVEPESTATISIVAAASCARSAGRSRRSCVSPFFTGMKIETTSARAAATSRGSPRGRRAAAPPPGRAAAATSPTVGRRGAPSASAARSRASSCSSASTSSATSLRTRSASRRRSAARAPREAATRETADGKSSEYVTARSPSRSYRSRSSGAIVSPQRARNRSAASSVSIGSRRSSTRVQTLSWQKCTPARASRVAGDRSMSSQPRAAASPPKPAGAFDERPPHDGRGRRHGGDRARSSDTAGGRPGSRRRPSAAAGRDRSRRPPARPHRPAAGSSRPRRRPPAYARRRPGAHPGAPGSGTTSSSTRTRSSASVAAAPPHGDRRASRRRRRRGRGRRRAHRAGRPRRPRAPPNARSTTRPSSGHGREGRATETITTARARRTPSRSRAGRFIASPSRAAASRGTTPSSSASDAGDRGR